MKIYGDNAKYLDYDVIEALYEYYEVADEARGKAISDQYLSGGNARNDGGWKG